MGKRVDSDCAYTMLTAREALCWLTRMPSAGSSSFKPCVIRLVTGNPACQSAAHHSWSMVCADHQVITKQVNLNIPLVNPSLITVTAAPDTIPSPCDTEAATLVLGAGAHLHPAGFNYKGCSWDLTQLQHCTVVATNKDYSKYDLALSGMRNSEQHHVWLAFANCQHEAKERIKYLPALRRRSNNPAAVLCSGR